MDESFLIAAAEKDAIYQKLLAECLLAEEDYHTICSRLSPQSRMQLEHYISLCEEMDHRKLQLALNMLA